MFSLFSLIFRSNIVESLLFDRKMKKKKLNKNAMTLTNQQTTNLSA